jgi:hypothetical protein
VARRLPNYARCRGCFAFEAPPSPLCSIHLWQQREAFYLPDARATNAQNKTKVFVCAFLTVTSSGPHACARVHTGDRTKVGGFSPLLLLCDSCRVRSSPKCVPRSLLTCYAQKASYLGAARCGFVFTPRCNSIIFSLRAYRYMHIHHSDVLIPPG